MSIAGVIVDVSGTMIDRRGQPAAGIIEAIARLRALGVQVVAAHNDGPHAQVARQLTQAGIAVDHIVTRYEILEHTAKGSPRWIERICADTGLERHQLLYVGDSDKDMITASHGRVIYFHALWSVPTHVYGLPAPAPGYIAAVVEHIFRKEYPWAWRVEHTTRDGTRLRQMALIDGNGAGDGALKADLISLLKREGDPMVGPMLLREFLVLHLVASIVAERLPDETDLWSTYPSRDRTRSNRLAQSLDVAAKLFRDTYSPDLLIRSRAAPHSRDAFRLGGFVAAIDNQLQTVVVNVQHQGRLQGKTVLMLDDFLTRGATVGVGRLLLRAGGARDMIAVAIGKYGPDVTLLGPPSPAPWDATAPPPFGGAACRQLPKQEAFNQAVLDAFVASHRAMQQERW